MFRSIKWRIAISFISLMLVSMAVFFFAEIDRAVIIALALVIGIAMLLALSITRATVSSIKGVTRAMEGIASGEIDQKIYVGTRDESAELAHAFNEMAQSIKQTIGTLSTERNMLAAMLSTMVDGVLMTNLEGNVLMANSAAEKLFGFKFAKGYPLIETIPDHEISDILQSCLRSGQQQAGQIDSRGRLLRVIATPIVVRARGPYPDTGDGHVLRTRGTDTYSGHGGALLIFQDLTEVKRFQTTRQEFVGNISHELRTPLASMKAVLETLNEGAIDDRPKLEDFLTMMGGEVDRMTRLVRELAELSRIETGQDKLKMAAVDLNSVIDQAITKLKPQSQRKQIDILRQSDPSLPMIPAEEERILQVLTNLLDNAIKFTPAGGKIIISAESEGESVLVTVEDTGVGIPADSLPHVFERFYKADKARSSEGTGLGLAIARHIVQAHGGEIWVKSKEGQGSVFSFRMPATKSRESRVKSEESRGGGLQTPDSRLEG
ncbi:MAG: ATP-binding protein [Dehalococcoidia bacterium]|nr:Sensor histidine kinase ResE [Chloroflexota bacterium]MBT9159412.1 Sensor histidine kinase ResE [Chloroflexota bacterium]